jgi:excinuclease ABC subunit B
MRAAIDETNRRRAIQVEYNEEHGITPETIVKGISDIAEFLQAESKVPRSRRRRQRVNEMPPAEIEKTIVELEEEMLAAAEELRFEYAAKLRDEIRDLKRQLDQAIAEGYAPAG